MRCVVMKHDLSITACKNQDEYTFTFIDYEKSIVFKVNKLSEGFVKILNLFEPSSHIHKINEWEKSCRKYFKENDIPELFYRSCVVCNKSWQSKNFPKEIEDFICEGHKK